MCSKKNWRIEGHDTSTVPSGMIAAACRIWASREKRHARAWHSSWEQSHCLGENSWIQMMHCCMFFFRFWLTLHQPGEILLSKSVRTLHAAYGLGFLCGPSHRGPFLPGWVERLWRRCLASTREWSPPEAPNTGLWGRTSDTVRYVCVFTLALYNILYIVT